MKQERKESERGRSLDRKERRDNYPTLVRSRSHSSSRSKSRDRHSMMPKWEVEEGREKRGECIGCGRRCYEIKKFKTIPITDPGRVINGRCLNCDPVDQRRRSFVVNARRDSGLADLEITIEDIKKSFAELHPSVSESLVKERFDGELRRNSGDKYSPIPNSPVAISEEKLSMPSSQRLDELLSMPLDQGVGKRKDRHMRISSGSDNQTSVTSSRESTRERSSSFESSLHGGHRRIGSDTRGTTSPGQESNPPTGNISCRSTGIRGSFAMSFDEMELGGASEAESRRRGRSLHRQERRGSHPNMRSRSHSSSRSKSCERHSVMPRWEVEEGREKRGECTGCGRRCYEIKKFKTIPITVPGRVLDGRCLNCNPVNQRRFSLERGECDIGVLARTGNVAASWWDSSLSDLGTDNTPNDEYVENINLQFAAEGDSAVGKTKNVDIENDEFLKALRASHTATGNCVLRRVAALFLGEGRRCWSRVEETSKRQPPRH